MVCETGNTHPISSCNSVHMKSTEISLFFCPQFLFIQQHAVYITFTELVHRSFPSSNDPQQRPSICKLVCTKATVALITGYTRSGLRLYYHWDSAWYNYGPDWLQSELIDWKAWIIGFDRTFWKAEKLLLKMAFRFQLNPGVIFVHTHTHTHKKDRALNTKLLKTRTR